MGNDILGSLLKEYEQKKIRAEIDLEKRKEKLYLLLPRLAEIEQELNYYAINTAKSILNTGKNVLQDFDKKVALLKNEKIEVLKSQNMDLTYLKPFYECLLCNDTGYILDSNNKTVMCSCLKQKLLDISFNKSNMFNLSKENFSTFNENFFSDEVDIARYKLNISPRTNIKNIKNKCQEFVNNFDNPEYKNLLFTGNTGLR